MSKTVRIKLIKSPISKLKKHQACIRGLGLRRVGHEVELEDTPAIRGKISKVNFMLEVEC